jgi:porphobilinogen synthase
VRETRLSVDSLIYPVFVVPGADVQAEVLSMPGVFHQLVDRLVEDARAVAVLGIPAFAVVPLATRESLARVSSVGRRRHRPAGHPSDQAGCAVAGRDCRHRLCEYTTHGHCGIPGPDDQPGFIDNDRSL